MIRAGGIQTGDEAGWILCAPDDLIGQSQFGEQPQQCVRIALSLRQPVGPVFDHRLQMQIFGDQASGALEHCAFKALDVHLEEIHAAAWRKYVVEPNHRHIDAVARFAYLVGPVIDIQFRGQVERYGSGAIADRRCVDRDVR
jgi:hypothetical protein